MKKIDRLIIRARKAAQAKTERFTVGFVTYEPDKGKYKACGHLWSGKKASGCVVMGLHGMTAQKPLQMP